MLVKLLIFVFALFIIVPPRPKNSVEDPVDDVEEGMIVRAILRLDCVHFIYYSDYLQLSKLFYSRIGNVAKLGSCKH